MLEAINAIKGKEKKAREKKGKQPRKVTGAAGTRRRRSHRLVCPLKTLLLRRRKGRRALAKRTEPSDFIIARSCSALRLLMCEFSTVRNRRFPGGIVKSIHLYIP